MQFTLIMPIMSHHIRNVLKNNEVRNLESAADHLVSWSFVSNHGNYENLKWYLGPFHGLRPHVARFWPTM